MKIINVRGVKPGTEGVVYCGRQWAGWKTSPLDNPYHKSFVCKVCKKIHTTPTDTIPYYKYWLVNNVVQENPVIIQAMKSLNKDSTLGCWCAPAKCHCEIIAEVWEQFFNERL